MSTVTTTSKPRTTCPVSRQQFTSTAKPVAVNIQGQVLSAAVKQFSTGSMGWFANGKVVVEVDGVPVACQVSLNITAIGSKELPEAPMTITPEVQAIIDAVRAKTATEEQAA
jgi:hypothetical protein